MCGRLSVIRDPLCHIVRDKFGISFQTDTNQDLRPTQQVACVMQKSGQLQQGNLIWGIQPGWTNSVIFNAKAETVSVKATFIDGFENSRVIVPCSGWYEWVDEQGQKEKYCFSPGNNDVFYVAGILLENKTKLIILTTESNDQCREYYERMPLLIETDCVMTWLTGPVERVFPLLINPFSDDIKINRA
ncbi:SOS response-associated peptidase [Vibrio salinus]|uniref:SOS response-associated peptidase n=1 Tax=Vibrio salinus TaxID=2899784 RepID=UPI001E5DBC37|nr:SOS response-associated peptidase family protein [Vibrio salinus]MCE0495359.1 SOS response-associated peptidase [Vibrio salinus]